MRAVVQRVRSASVSVASRKIAAIQCGLVVLLGVGPVDTSETACALAEKISRLRIFEDEAGK